MHGWPKGKGSCPSFCHAFGASNSHGLQTSGLADIQAALGVAAAHLW